MRTNTAAGLMLAGMEISNYAREDSVKVVVLLSDGLANAAYVSNPPTFNIPPLDARVLEQRDNWYCPLDYWKARADGHDGPWCTDGDPDQGYVNPAVAPGSGQYHGVQDPDDAARYFADWLACFPPGENTLCYSDPPNQGGLGAVIFAIGLGQGVSNYDKGPSAIVGGELLRYIAWVGFNGDPRYNATNTACRNQPPTVSCDNYYYAEEGADLDQVFKDIASRIFTRLTH
jgi:hypothetical protein